MKRRLGFLLFAPVLLMVIFGASAFANAPQAHAATLHRAAPQTCNLISQYAGVTESGPVYQVSGYNGTSNNATLHLGVNKTVSNSLTATIGFSVSFISATVGFNVTASTAVTYDFTITVPPFKTGHIYVYVDFWTYLLTNSCTHAQAVAEGFDGGIAYVSSIT